MKHYPAPGGGTSNGINLFVHAAAAVACEFVNVTTNMIAGSPIPAFSIRFRDQYGNLTDTPIGTVNFTELTGASSGTLTLTRSSLGVSSATVKRFYEAGDYILWVEGMTTTTGSRSFTVGSATDNRVTFTGVPTTVPAGAVVPSFTLHFTDAFGNLTDNGIGRLTYRRGTGTSSTATLAITRVSEGIYTAQSTICTLAGTYTLAMSSVSAANTFGTKSFVISSLAAVSATFSGVSISLNAGAQQAAFDIRYRDVYGNFTDTGIANAVQFSNATTANVGASTGTIAVYRRLGIGLYEVTRATFTTAGNYTLQVSGVVNTGHRVFRLVPSTTVRFVDFMTLPPNVYMGAEQAVSIFYRDPYNNSIESNRTLSFTKSGTPSSTGTLTLTDGTLLGETIATFSKITVPGTYSLTVSGMTPTMIRTLPGNSGLPTIQVFENEGNIDRICFETVQTPVYAGSGLPFFTARYILIDGNPSITVPREVRYENLTNPAITGIIPMRRISGGRAESSVIPTLTVAGTYRLFVADAGVTPACELTFDVLGNTAASITALTTPHACLTAGQALTPLSFEVRDRFGNLTNEFNNDALEYRPVRGTFTAAPNTSTGTILLTTATVGVLSQVVPRVFTTAGTYTMQIPIYYIENLVASTTLTFCVQPDVAANIITLSAPGTCIEAGQSLPAFTLVTQDRFGNITGRVNSEMGSNFPFIGTFAANAPGVSTGTLNLVTTAVATLEQQNPLRIFTTVGTYSLNVPVFVGASLAATGTMPFCVTGATATTARLEGVNPVVNLNASQGAFTVEYRDVFGNFTNLGVSMLRVRFDNGNGANGTFPLRRTGTGTAQADAPMQPIFSAPGTYTLTVLSDAGQILASTTFRVGILLHLSVPNTIDLGNVVISEGASQQIRIMSGYQRGNIRITSSSPNFVIATTSTVIENFRDANSQEITRYQIVAAPVITSNSTVILTTNAQFIINTAGYFEPDESRLTENGILPATYIQFSVVALPIQIGITSATISLISDDPLTIPESVQVSANGVQPELNQCAVTSSIVNDYLFAPVHHRYGAGSIFGVNGRLASKPPAAWHLCDPDFPNADIDAVDAWLELGYTGDRRIGIGIAEGRPNDGANPDLNNYTGKSIYERLPNENNFNMLESNRGDHALAVAGFAAASGNNNLGVSGIDQEAHVVFIDAGTSIGSLAQAINNSQVRNLRVINNSYISSNPSGIYRDYANAYKNNIVIVAGTGNFHNRPFEFIGFPAALRLGAVLGVGASNRQNQRESFSQIGSHIDLIAPGVTMMTTRTANPVSTVKGDFYYQFDVMRDPALIGRGSDYDNFGWSIAGTSFSSPIVSGAASLMIGYAEYKRTPSIILRNDDVEKIFHLSADKISLPYSRRTGHTNNIGEMSFGTWNQEMGYGKLNVLKAMRMVRDGEIRHLASGRVRAGEVNTATSQPFVMNSSATFSVEFVDCILTSMFAPNGAIWSSENVRNCRKYEVRQHVEFPSGTNPNNIALWGTGSDMTSGGYNQEVGVDGKLINFGVGWSTPVRVEATGATLKTFVYELLDNSGNRIGWLPCSPQNVRFSYTVFSHPDVPTLPVGGMRLAFTQEKNESQVSYFSGIGGTFPSLRSSPTNSELIVSPNPFSSFTTIEYSVSETSQIQLEVIDNKGISVSILDEGIKNIGKYSIQMDGTKLSSGSYRVNLKTISTQSGQAAIKTLPLVLIK